MRQLSRLERIEALGHTHLESDLPPIVRDWCVGDEVLYLVEGEFEYSDLDAWKQLKPLTRERVLARYRIFAGMIVLESREGSGESAASACSMRPLYS